MLAATTASPPAGAAVNADEMRHQRRPDRAGEIIAGGGNGDRDAAAAREPVRDIRHQRSEGGRATETDQQPVSNRHLPKGGGVTDRDIASAERQRADDDRHGDAETVGESAHDDAASGKAEHGQRIGHRCCGAIDAEFRLDRGQGDHHRPHADATDGAEHDGRRQPQPGCGGVGRVRLGSTCGCTCSDHGEDMPGYGCQALLASRRWRGQPKAAGCFLIIILSY